MCCLFGKIINYIKISKDEIQIHRNGSCTVSSHAPLGSSSTASRAHLPGGLAPHLPLALPPHAHRAQPARGGGVGTGRGPLRRSLSPGQWLSSAMPLPARRPPLPGHGPGHIPACSLLLSGDSVTRSPGSPGMPGSSWGPRRLVFLLRNAFAASAPTRPTSSLVPSVGGRREGSLRISTLCMQ